MVLLLLLLLLTAGEVIAPAEGPKDGGGMVEDMAVVALSALALVLEEPGSE